MDGWRGIPLGDELKRLITRSSELLQTSSLSHHDFQTLVLSTDEVSALIDMSECIKLQEGAFAAFGQGKAYYPSKCRLAIKPNSGKLVYQAGYIETEGALAARITSSFLGNPSKYGLPRSMRLSVLYDDKSGYPLAVLDGTYIMAMSRGSSAALSAKYLARRADGINVAVLGSGLMARACSIALPLVTNVSKISIYSKTKDHRTAFAREMSEALDLSFVAVDSTADAVRGAKIIVTATNSSYPVLLKEMVEPGSHIIGMGNKTEIEPSILSGAKIVVDSIEQATDVGFVAQGIKGGAITRDAIYAEFGEIVTGKKEGRTSDDEVTFFDNSGLGIQDAAIARGVYERARGSKIGRSLQIVSSSESYPLMSRVRLQHH